MKIDTYENVNLIKKKTNKQNVYIYYYDFGKQLQVFLLPRLYLHFNYRKLKDSQKYQYPFSSRLFYYLNIPSLLYPRGGSKHASSTTQLSIPSSWITVTPSTDWSNAWMLPKVILAFSTWNRGISEIRKN